MSFTRLISCISRDYSEIEWINRNKTGDDDGDDDIDGDDDDDDDDVDGEDGSN